MPAPNQRIEARDLHEAVESFIEARGRRCNVCTGHSPSWDGHDANPPCETFAFEALRQRFAETRPTPGMTEDAALWAVTQRLFDDVARVAEADTRKFGGVGETLARFLDLPDDHQRIFVTGLRGAFMQMAQVARSKAKR